jgi:hypothetical protein
VKISPAIARTKSADHDDPDGKQVVDGESTWFCIDITYWRYVGVDGVLAHLVERVLSMAKFGRGTVFDSRVLQSFLWQATKAATPFFSFRSDVRLSDVLMCKGFALSERLEPALGVSEV